MAKIYKRKGSNNFYIQVRIPKSITAHYNNKTHVTKSLKTANRNTAKQRAAVLEAEIRSEFEALLNPQPKQNIDIYTLVEELREYANHPVVGVDDHPAIRRLERNLHETGEEILTEDDAKASAALSMITRKRVPISYVIALYKEDKFPRLAPNTQKAYTVTFNQLLKHFGKFKDMQSIEPLEAREFVKELRQTVKSDNSINTKLQQIISLYNYAEEMDLIASNTKNPFKSFKVKQSARKRRSATPTASVQSIRSALEYAQNNKKQRKLALPQILRVSYYTGARGSDVYLMKPEDLSTDKNGNLMLEIQDKKDKDPYSIPIATVYKDQIERDLRELQQRFKQVKTSESAVNKPTAALFKKLGFPYSHHSIRNLFEQALKDAGVSYEIRLFLQGKEALIGSSQHYGEDTMDSNRLLREINKLPNILD